jgi:hypothetical protein
MIQWIVFIAGMSMLAIITAAAILLSPLKGKEFIMRLVIFIASIAVFLAIAAILSSSMAAGTCIPKHHRHAPAKAVSKDPPPWQFDLFRQFEVWKEFNPPAR